MIIFNAGSVSCSNAATLTEITVLRALAPSAPLMVLAEEEFPEDVVAVVQSGAEGYVSNHSAPDLVLRAFSFVLKGGTYVPRSAVSHGSFRGQEPLNGDHEPHDADVDGEELDGNPPSLAERFSAISVLATAGAERAAEGYSREAVPGRAE